jgi:hypothetical protein
MLPNTNYKIEIPVNYGKLSSILGWCKDNCKENEWAYQVTESAGRDAGLYEFYFQDERDYVNFILWKT